MGGVRERKKADTARRLAGAALDLAAARGLHGFTVADVADAAGVSPRTFFNYFRTKEEALFRWDAAELEQMAAALLGRPGGEHPVHALAAAITPSPDHLSEMVRTWNLRRRLVDAEPALLPHHLAGIKDVEERLAAAMRERLGAPPDDPFPTVVVAAAMGAFRSALEWREGVDQPVRVLELLADVLEMLQSGFRR